MFRHIFLAITVSLIFLGVRLFFGQNDDSGNVLKLNNSKEFSLVVLDDNYDLIEDTLDVNLHMKYVEEFLNQPRNFKLIGDRVSRKDYSLLNYYNSYCQSGSEQVSNIGKYILGVYHCSIGNYSISLSYFQNLPIIDSTNRFQYWKSRANIHSKNHEEGKLELTNLLSKGYRQDSTLKYLILGLYRKLDLIEVKKYFNIYQNSNNYLSDEEQLVVYRNTCSTINYIFNYLKLKATKFPFYASFFVALCWLIILLRLNIFNSPIFPGAILVLVLSALSMIFLIDVVYGIYGEWLYGRTQRLTNFTYCVSVIGAGEELIKAIPLFVTLIILRPKDPVQILLYGALSGLMFSFIENISYINKYGVNIISVRGYSPTILHIVLTATVAYAYIYSKFVSKKNSIIWILFSFALVAVIHGAYDYFIFLNNYLKMKGFSGFSYLIVYLMVLAFGMYIANSLNISPHFSNVKSNRLVKRSFIIIVCLFAIEFFEYGSVLYSSGQNRADLWIVVNMGSAIFTVYFLALCFTYKDLIHGHWTWYNAVPFINNTYLNKYIDNTVWVAIGELKFTIIPRCRIVDRKFNSNFLSVESDELAQYYNGLELHLKFNRKWWKPVSLNTIQIGYFGKSGQFVFLDNVKIENFS